MAPVKVGDAKETDRGRASVQKGDSQKLGEQTKAERLKGAKGKSFRSSLSSNKNFCGRVVINQDWQR